MAEPGTQAKEAPLVPHPDDEAEVRAGLEEAQRDEVLSRNESAAYLRSLLGDEDSDR